MFVRSILVDTGILVAVFDSSDPHHQRALQFLDHEDMRLITTTPVVAETMALLGFSLQSQLEFLEWCAIDLTIDTELQGDIERIAAIMHKYADLPADFADASLVALAERRSILNVATIDRDFSVYRTKDKKRFRNLF